MVEGINTNTPKEVSVNPDVEAYLCCALIPENARAVSATFQRDANIAPAQSIVFTPIDYRTSAVATRGSAQETAVVDAAVVQNPTPTTEVNTRSDVRAGNGVSTQALLDAGVQPAAPAAQGDGAVMPTGQASSGRGVSTKDLLAAGKQEPPNFTVARSQIYISQQGDSSNPANWFGCGGTSLLNALADWDLMEPTEANRQALLDEIVPTTGTSTRQGGKFPGGPDEMALWAQAHGLQSEDHSGDTSIDSIDRALQEGKGVILNAPNHFVYILGKDSQGRYVVADPSYPDTPYWDRATVNAKLTAAPAFGFTTVWRGPLKGPRQVTA